MADDSVWKAHEETTTRNVRTAVEHGNESRRLVRELETKVEKLEKQIMLQEQKFNEMKKQLSAIQQKVFAGGSSNEH